MWIKLRRRPYRVECTGSLSTSEVKQHRARLVLGWGTAWEDLRVLSALHFKMRLWSLRADLCHWSQGQVRSKSVTPWSHHSPSPAACLRFPLSQNGYGRKLVRKLHDASRRNLPSNALETVASSAAQTVWAVKEKGCCAALTCQRPVQCILEADPTSAESAQINLLCCQPGYVSRTSPA